MSYFYADGTDKAGNRLMTSYKREAQARKYRADAKITQGEKFLQIQEDGSAKIGSTGDLLVRTLMVRPSGADEEMSGDFVVYARINGKWQPTEFRYKTYATANAAVKSALINLYSACAIVEDDGSSASPSSAPVATDEEAVF